MNTYDTYNITEPSQAEIKPDQPHCATCICGQPGNIEILNRRIQRLLAANPIDLSMISEDRLSVADTYRCGFTGFKISAYNDTFAGQFLMSIHPFVRPAEPEGYWDRHHKASCTVDDERYEVRLKFYRDKSRFFSVNVREPRISSAPSMEIICSGADLLPQEYRPGGMFDITGSPSSRWMMSIAARSDENLLQWLDAYRVALRDYAIRMCQLSR